MGGCSGALGICLTAALQPPVGSGRGGVACRRGVLGGLPALECHAVKVVRPQAGEAVVAADAQRLRRLTVLQLALLLLALLWVVLAVPPLGAPAVGTCKAIPKRS